MRHTLLLDALHIIENSLRSIDADINSRPKMRIVGINIPDNKRIEYALPYIYGVGLARARKILLEAKIDFAKRTKDLEPAEINRIQAFIERNYKVEGELRQRIKEHIGLLKELQAYRG